MSDNLIDELRRKPLPDHIGVIMDGNGRWAKKRNLPREFGHKEGMKRVVDLVENIVNIGIPYLTIYAFSTENWKRPASEISSLMDLLVLYVNNELSKLNKKGVKVNVYGDISVLPEKSIKSIEKAIAKTSANNKLILNIAINYGGQQEIVRAFKEMYKQACLGSFSVDMLDEHSIKNFLYSKNQPDPDLIIRPSGELRLSNFLTYQSAYSELWFSDVLWPDFDMSCLYEAIKEYQSRNRRFGGV